MGHQTGKAIKLPSSPVKNMDQDASNAAPGYAPAWSELKTKAGKERKRLPLACKSCRRKKVRCSGETPSCKHCSRAKIPCVYKVTQRKATPRTDYMTMLDKRLKRMEERVIKLMPTADSAKVATIGRASVKPPNADKNKSSSKKRAAVEAFAPSESEDTSKLQTHSLKDKSDTSSLMEGIEHLPPSDIQQHLGETYFDFCYGQPYHLLHKPSFMRRLRAGTIPPVLMLAVCSIAARFSTHPYFNGEPPGSRGDNWANEARKLAARSVGEPNMTIVIVVTLLALFDFGSCQGGRAWMYAGIGMRMCYALQLNQEHDHETAEAPDQGHLVGPSGKKDKLVSPELSFTDQEIRRRTMWACFLMDCFNSSGTKRPSFDHVPNISIQLPIKEQFFQMEIPAQTEDINGNPGKVSLPDDYVGNSTPRENMGVAAYLVKSLALWWSVVSYVNSGRMHEDILPPWHPDSDFIVLRQKVYKWGKELPSSLQWTPEVLRNHEAEKVANQYCFMHIVYQQIILFMHKFTIPAFPGANIPSQMPPGFRDESRKAAVHAAAKISRILEASNEKGQMTAPFVSYCTFASSTVHIWGIFGGKNTKIPTDQCARFLGVNMRYLQQMKQYWSMIHYMTESVKDIYKTHADSARRGIEARHKKASGDESFFEYGDMQDREYPTDILDDNGSRRPSSPGQRSKRYTQLGEKSNLKSVGEWFQEKSQSPQLLAAEIPNRPSKRGKHQPTSSQAHNHSLDIKGARSSPSQQHQQIPAPKGMQLDAMSLGNTPTPPDTTGTSVSFANTPRSLMNTHSPPSFPDANAGTQFAVSNPYHDLNMSAPFGNAAGTGLPGGNPFMSRLPMQAYDRTLVYGAYSNEPALAFDNPFDMNAGVSGVAGAHAPAFGNAGADGMAGMGMGSGAVNPGMTAHLGGLNPHAGMGAAGNGMGPAPGHAGFGDASAAWLTPFHIPPPINLVQPEYTTSGQADGMGFGMNGDGSGNNMDFWST